MDLYSFYLVVRIVYIISGKRENIFSCKDTYGLYKKWYIEALVHCSGIITYINP